MTIKSTRTISGEKKVVETIKKNASKETNLERERERERIDLFVVNNLEGIGERERGGNEVKEFFNKIKLEE